MNYNIVFCTNPFLVCFDLFSKCLLSFWTLTLFTVILFLWGKTAFSDFWHVLCWVLLLMSLASLLISFGGSLCSTAEGVRSTDLLMPGMTGSGVRLSHSSEVIVTSLMRGGGRGRAHLSHGLHLRCTWRLSTRWPRTWTYGLSISGAGLVIFTLSMNFTQYSF